MGYVMSGMTLLSEDTKVLLGTLHHGALHALTTGVGTKDDWDSICNLLNLSLVLDEQVYQRAFRKEIDVAMAAHAACGKRLHKHGRFGYTGEELRHVNLALEVHDQQLKQTTIKEIEDAKATVYKRLRAKQFKYRVKSEPSPDGREPLQNESDPALGLHRTE